MHPGCAAVFFAEQLHVQLRWIASALGFIVRCIRGGLASLPYLGFLASEEPESVKRTVLATRPRPTFLDLTVICRTRLNIPLDMAAYSFPLATLFTRKTVNLYAICFCGLHRVVHYRISVQNRLSPAAGR